MNQRGGVFFYMFSRVHFSFTNFLLLNQGVWTSDCRLQMTSTALWQLEAQVTQARFMGKCFHEAYSLEQ